VPEGEQLADGRQIGSDLFSVGVETALYWDSLGLRSEPGCVGEYLPWLPGIMPPVPCQQLGRGGWFYETAITENEASVGSIY